MSARRAVSVAVTSVAARRAAVLILVTGTLGALIVGSLIGADLDGDRRTQLRALTEDAAAGLESRLAVVDQTLVTLAADARVRGADTDAFTRVAETGGLVERTPGIRTLSLARDARSVTGVQTLIVEQLVPAELADGVVGVLDLYREEERRRATQTARDLGISTTTAPRILAYGGVGVLYYVPIYTRDVTTEPERRRAFLGVAIAVVDPAELLSGQLGPERLVDIVVSDRGPVVPDRFDDTVPKLVWTSSSGPVVATDQESGIAADIGLDLAASPAEAVSVDVMAGDRLWRVEASPTELLADQGWIAWAAASGVMAFALLLAALVGAVLGARDRAEGIVEVRTAELSNAYERLLVTERLRSQFISTVSHELRTPLTAILGFVQTVLRHGPDADAEQVHQWLGRAERQGVLLRRMIEELLDFGRLERGDVTVSPERVALDEELPVYVDDLRPVLGERPVTVSVTPGCTVEVDPPAFQRVLGNLVSNAVRYAPDGTAIDIDLSRDGEHVVLTVADRGPGLSSQDLPHVFERFYRGAGVMGEGTGIGLAVVRSLVEAHHGRVSLDNREGGGAVATITLPAAEPTQEADDRPSTQDVAVVD